MIADDRRAFAEMLHAVYVFYGKEKDFSDTAVSIWWQCCEHFDLVAVREAISKHVQNPDGGMWLPKPADVVRMLGGSTLDSALVAVHKFEKAVRLVGPHMTVAFNDPLIHVVVDEMGGWVALNALTAKDWDFRRNEFLNRYRAYKHRREVPAYLPKLTGIADAENGRRGFKVDDSNLRLIGNPDEARKVIALGSASGRLQITDGAGLVTKALTAIEEKT